ncbi:unnamed protein product [Adineta steineri]|uniref:Mth938 domain-containing protein n=1 Tax=Adineta steineri TaxID=433720 RepID=A0A813MVR4_9BILA|nr:unnamed protein product [Adineta steineri]CAF0911178.1 unnamed protein product [Adineta steineri]
MAESDNEHQKQSPLIEHLEWGRVEVEGFPPGKDFRLFPGGAEEWDWKKTNTRHVPGVQLKDVEYLIEKEAEYIVLSKGMKNQLQIAEETEDFLKEKGMMLDVNYFIETTPEAQKRYNELAKNKKRVGALIHSTC